MKIALKDVRLSFPELYVPREFKKGDGRPRYSSKFLIEEGSANDKAIQKAINETAEEKLGKNFKKILDKWRGQKLQWCYRESDMEDTEDMEGVWELSAHRPGVNKSGVANPPKIVDRAKQELTAESGKPYAGCYVNAVVDFWIQEGENPGLRCGFSVVQFYRDGEAFSASEPDLDDLPDLDEDVDEDDDMEGLV